MSRIRVTSPDASLTDWIAAIVAMAAMRSGVKSNRVGRVMLVGRFEADREILLHLQHQASRAGIFGVLRVFDHLARREPANADSQLGAAANGPSDRIGDEAAFLLSKVGAFAGACDTSDTGYSCAQYLGDILGKHAYID